MPEGPMNVEPLPVEVAVETEAVAENPVTEPVPAGQAVNFPTPQPRLTAGGSATLKALRGR
jgi:hypothetical protein